MYTEQSDVVVMLYSFADIKRQYWNISNVAIGNINHEISNTCVSKYSNETTQNLQRL